MISPAEAQAIVAAGKARGLISKLPPVTRQRTTQETLRACVLRVAARGVVFDALDVRDSWDGFATRSAYANACEAEVQRGTLRRVPSGRGGRHMKRQYAAAK
jgi:hypothetical protein